jgi:hypothetical protein
MFFGIDIHTYSNNSLYQQQLYEVYLIVFISTMPTFE